MAIGERAPITFMTLAIVPEEGGASEEVFTAAKQTWAVVAMRKSQLNADGGGTLLADTYRFSEVRFDAGFVPDKTMKIQYNGRELIINSILLDDQAVPPYYVITASENG